MKYTMLDRYHYFASQANHPRFWWFAINDYLPPIYAGLEDDEFALLVEWFEETERQSLIGECNIPAMSEMLGFVTGNGIDSIVQCGHYSGYSTLLMGWALRRMGKKQALISFDIDADVTDFTNSWIERAGLQDVVRVIHSDSANPQAPIMAHAYFGGYEPKMVFIDSSHQYAHTLAEIDLWFGALRPGGLIFLHDVSDFARSFDTTHSGGVGAALVRWRIGLSPESVFGLNDEPETIMLNRVTQIASKDNPLHDGCGLGIIQK